MSAMQSNSNQYREQSIDVLARTIYGEARGESVRGKEAVAAVVINRVRRARLRNGYWWGHDIKSVCQKPWQFSCWNEDDPNFEKITAATSVNNVFKTCLRIARRAVAGTLKDPTGGATHYHALGIEPPWARSQEPSATIGRHKFYANIE